MDHEFFSNVWAKQGRIFSRIRHVFYHFHQEFWKLKLCQGPLQAIRQVTRVNSDIKIDFWDPEKSLKLLIIKKLARRRKKILQTPIPTFNDQCKVCTQQLPLRDYFYLNSSSSFIHFSIAWKVTFEIEITESFCSTVRLPSVVPIALRLSFWIRDIVAGR